MGSDRHAGCGFPDGDDDYVVWNHIGEGVRPDA
jgi:hypothetical protein